MRIPFRGFRSFAATNADRQERARVISFPVLLTAPIAEKKCTTAPHGTLKNDRIVSSALPLAKREKTCAVVLEKGVLRFLQILLWYISDCEDLFRDKLGAKRKEDFKKELAAKRRQLTKAQRRMEELDRLFKRLYEDNISGKINDSRFENLSADYENEQAELTEKM